MRMLVWAVPILAAMQISALADTILPGTEIRVSPDVTVDVSRWDRGRIYPAHVERDVMARDGDVAIPHGASAELIVRQTGPGQFVLDLESITVNGNRYAVDTSSPQFNMPQNEYNNGSGVVGAIIGAIAGANGMEVETHGDHVDVPAGAVLRFNLREPLHVVGWSDPGYQRGEYHYHHEGDWYR